MSNPYYNNQPQQPPQAYSQQQPYPPQQPYPNQPPQYAQQQQQYAPPPPQANYGPKSQGGPTMADAFDARPKFQDLWAALLFLAQFLAFLAISVISISAYKNSKSSQGGGIDPTMTPTLDTHTITLFAFVLVAAFVLSFVYLMIARAIPRKLITTTYILSILVQFGVAIYYFIEKYYSGAVIFLIFAVLYALTWFSWRRRIPFASELLVAVINIASEYKAVYVVAVLSMIAQIVYSAWFAVTLVSAYIKYDPSSSAGCTAGGGSCGTGSVIVVVIFLTFSYYWTSQVIQNVAFTTICGTYGSYYFCSGSQGGMPKNPTWGSFKRASTYSFGSICFGSLIIALIQLVRAFVAVARSQAAQSGDSILSIVLCCVDCCIGCIEGYLQWVNKYAYTEVALYGKSYVRAGKDTWQIIKDRGFDLIINDQLIGTVITMGSFAIGALTALFGYLYDIIQKPDYNSTGNYTPIIILYSFLVGFQISRTVMSVIDAGEATTFVALAEDPGALARTKPELFEKFRQTYPQVVQGV